MTPSHSLVAEVAGRLVLLREHLGLSQREMAFRLGMTHRAYATWEEPTGRRQRPRTVAFLNALDRVTGVSIAWLLGSLPSDVPLGRDGKPMRARDGEDVLTG